MKKLSKRAKTTIFTNVVITLIIAVVISVSFFPEKIEAMYGGSKISAIYSGNKEHANVSLMFNVYENKEVVNKIVDLLDEKGVKATFFIGGCWADDNGETLKRITSSGHEIGNHGYFHKDHKKLSYEDNREEIYLTGVVINALCGQNATLFAPPSGSFSVNTLDACSDLGYKCIMWSKDTIDWRDSDVDLIVKRATKNAENGDLILMHPKPHTLKALSRIIDYYLSAGFSLVTVGENVLGIE